MIKIIGDTKIDFLGKRKIGYILSGLLTVVGIVAAVQVGLGHGNLAIEFTGGTMVQGSFAQPISIGNLRSMLTEGGFPEAEIKALETRGVPNSYMIRVKEDAAGQTQSAQKVVDLIRSRLPDNAFEVDSMHEVGPSVGETLRGQASRAVLISLVCILIYIWFRFDFRFGVASTVATVHDVLVVLGILFIFNREISLLVVSGLLTLAGFSLTDKVVVFDRVRENLKGMRRRGDFATTINTSMNEVLSRTIVTGMTTQIAVIILMVFGGEVLFDFSMTIFLGFIVGTYSSWFVASPLVVDWERVRPSRYK